MANSKITELGLTYMEVSAKTGNNIKEFFKEMACVIAGGKKSKDEPATSKSSAQPAQPKAAPAQATTGNVSLSANQTKEGGRKNKKCEC